MLDPVRTVALTASLEAMAPRHRETANTAQHVFVNELVAALRASLGRLGLKAGNIQVTGTDRDSAAAGGNLPPRQILVTLSQSDGAPAADPPLATPPYVPFETRIPPSDIGAINVQQTARNAAFRAWVDGIRSRLEAMGCAPEVVFDQPPDNLYVIPVTATLRFPDGGPSASCALTLYHYDAWQGMDPAAFVRDLARSY